MLHLTIIQMDLADENRLNQAKAMMKDLENEFQKQGGQLSISFKGLKTSDYMNPSLATALYADIDTRSQVQGFNNLKKIISRIIEEALNRSLVSKEDLAKSFINVDSQKKYTNRKLNVALIQTGLKSNKKFNASQIIEKYSDASILGDIDISQIHLSSKKQYQTQDGSKRMDKELFGNLLNQADKDLYYACESKIQLSIDDLFG